MNVTRRKPLVPAVSFEAVAIETRQAFGGAEPEQAVRIRNYLVDRVAWQPIRSCIRLDGQLFAT